MKKEKRNEKKTAAEVAANWWVEKVFETSPNKFDMGEENPMLQMLAMMNSMQATPEDSQGLAFKKMLIKKISQEVKKYGRCTLSTDYHPEGVLLEIANEVGISESSFPWKTCMHVSEMEVTVKCGYGADFVTIYPQAEEHV